MANKQDTLYYGRDVTVTVTVKRLQATYDGTSQLASAIGRLLRDWDDVWDPTSVSIKVAQARSFTNFEQEDALKAANVASTTRAKIILARQAS
jgi:hypothetical protein